MITRGDLELAEQECPDVLLDVMLQLFLPNFEAEVKKQRRERAKQREKTNMIERRPAHYRKRYQKPHKRKGKASFLSPPHPALIQSAAYGLTWSSSASLSTTSTSGMKRSESFTVSRLSVGMGAAPGESEEDDATPATTSDASKQGRKRADRDGNQHPFFAIFCRLIYTQRPGLLVPFVQLLSIMPPSTTSQTSASTTPTLINLALNALPPFPYHQHVLRTGRTTNASKESELFDKQLEARVWLLCRAGQSANGIYF